tara:strand:+ start:133 stop:477 length:345 start_codon:yes stop_codon:yes gene_type:complete
VGCGESQPLSEADKALIQAAVKGDIEAVKQHLAAGADVNAKHETGGTPLHEAAHKDHGEIVELLIAKGADVNAKIGKGGPTPLNFVNSRIQPETFALLRKHGGKTRAELKAEGK